VEPLNLVGHCNGNSPSLVLTDALVSIWLQGLKLLLRKWACSLNQLTCKAHYSLQAQNLPPTQELVPVYVGKSNNPLKRWEDHINGLKEGTGHYSKWRETLLEDGKAKFDISLSLIPASIISRPPIPEFPTTIGSVEYQLVELVSESYPETSLNVEGKQENRARCRSRFHPNTSSDGQ
jgi:hypothetical protein